MPKKDRSQLRFFESNEIAKNTQEVKDLDPIPAGEQWQMQTLLLADQNVGDNISGGFILEWGTPGSFELIHTAFLTGSTSRLIIKRAFLGDGAKFFRISRENNSNQAKSMIVVLEGFERVGD